MTFEEFEKIVNKVALTSLDSYASKWDDRDGFTIEDGKIIQKHVSGGAEGGNCWGDEARRFSNDKRPAPFYPLDKILKTVAPNISYLKYREIEDLIGETVDTEREYYGNHTDYNVFSLDIRELYDIIFSK